MIYPPATGPGSSKMRSSGVKTNSVSGSGCTKGVRNGRKNGKAKQQVVQWKQRNVQEGIVIVDEQQLSKLIKRDPIQKFYELDPEPFATGLFASVRRCKSRDTGQQFAAKFSSRARYGEDCSAEIHHEIALLSLCSPSARVIRLHDVFETPKEIIIVLEFAPGGDMQTIIDDNLVPFETDVVKFVRQLVEGLAYLHERKIAHLDIKPQNLVMMADFPDCDVKLCDFEISRVILEGTEIREILGTPDYVAPEILHYEPITLKADMWSLGVTTYVLLTGFSPFGGETDQETFCNISKAEVDFPEELFEDVSEEAQDFIARLLVRDPGARPTAKECLRHKWLSKKTSRTTTPPNLLRQDSSLLVRKPNQRTPSPSDESGRTGPRSGSQQQKNLRKYLSKSREALFERVVQQQQQHQRNSLRKTTLLSQYHKTRRLCESQMSLVSKSRERLLMMDQHQMSPYFSRSREKLYGLRSLSKSHEVLDLCKTTPGGNIQDGVGLGLLRTLTRATTADLSMIPLLRQRLMGHGSSTTSITSSVTTDIDLDDPIMPQSPSEHVKFTRMTSAPNSVIQSPMATTTIEELIEHSSQESLTMSKPEPITPVPELLSPSLLKETLMKQNKFEFYTDKEKLSTENNEEIETDNTKNSLETVYDTPDTSETKVLVQTESSSNETLVFNSTPEPFSQGNDDTESNTVEVVSQTKNDTNAGPSINTTEEDRTFDSESTDIATENEKNVVNENEKVNEKRNGEESEEDNEPRYTVAQLVSAFNRHQEVITKTSLEVTMTTNDKETKIPPVLFQIESSKFPTGPNALRLFIPDIDISNEPSKRKQKRRYNVGIRYPNQNEQSSEKEDASKEIEELSKDILQLEDDESFQSLDSTSSITGNEYDSITNISLPEDFVVSEENLETDQGKENVNNGQEMHASLEAIEENIDSTNNNYAEEVTSDKSLAIDQPVTNTKDKIVKEDSCTNDNSTKLQISVEVTPPPNYLRSGSLSSDISAASSETSSSMSWEELTPPSTATPTSTKDEPQQWPQKSTSLNVTPKQTTRSRSPSIPRESWGRICTGTYTRAMEKFNSKVKQQDTTSVPMDPKRRPNRKSLSLLSAPQVISSSEKVRRKSIPVIKQHS